MNYLIRLFHIVVSINFNKSMCEILDQNIAMQNNLLYHFFISSLIFSYFGFDSRIIASHLPGCNSLSAVTSSSQLTTFDCVWLVPSSLENLRIIEYKLSSLQVTFNKY